MSLKDSGYIKIAELFKVPIFVHWSLPVAGVLLSAFTGFKLATVFYYCISYAMLVFIHEAGHLLAAKAFELKTFSIQITAAGGTGRSEMPKTIAGALFFYAGGIIAQLALLAVTVTSILTIRMPNSEFIDCIIITFIYVNIVLIVVNLIPHKVRGGLKTDGYYLWVILFKSLMVLIRK